jgi:hypothetical protein
MRLELVLVRDADPVQGYLRDERGRTVSFAGWLDLMAIIDALLEDVDRARPG